MTLWALFDVPLDPDFLLHGSLQSFELRQHFMMGRQ